jgi:hypothetical protein
MATSRLDKETAMKVGLGVIFFALLLMAAGLFAIPAIAGLSDVAGFYYFLGVGAMALAGFILLMTSLFLPSRSDRQTFTQELLGKESLHYGTYTKGNWMEVLDEEGRRRKKDDGEESQ